MSKFSVVKLEITDGECASCYFGEYPSWIALNQATYTILLEHDRRYPDGDGGYVKTDVKVTWSNGVVWPMRLDIGENSRYRDARAAAHIRDYIHFAIEKPAHLTSDLWESFFNNTLEDRIAWANDFLNNYELPE